MFALFYTFLVGMLVSFLGQIPLGNMNMVATTLSVEEGWKTAWRFGLGVAIIEIIYLRIALTGMDWVAAHKTIFTVLAWITVVLFLVLGVITVIKAGKQSGNKKGAVIDNNLNRFVMGMSLSAVNPVQIPFWFTWSLSLIKTGVLQTTNASYNFFTVGAGLGTHAGLAIYIHGGKWAINKMGAKNRTLNYVMGAVFILAALIQLYKIIVSPW